MYLDRDIMIIVMIEMMIVVVVKIVVMSIRSWGEVTDQKWRNNFLCYDTSDF